MEIPRKASKNGSIIKRRYQGSTLNALGRPVFLRYDFCEFVKCTILIDERTGKLAITNCIFEDCNIDRLSSG